MLLLILSLVGPVTRIFTLKPFLIQRNMIIMSQLLLCCAAPGEKYKPNKRTLQLRFSSSNVTLKQFSGGAAILIPHSLKRCATHKLGSQLHASLHI